MDLDLDRMLANARNGQWSLDDFEWDRPLEGAEHLSGRQRKEAGLSLVFTAGLERQAARIFLLSADYVDDERAKQIYRLFAADELRHADAEMRLARRYGVTWDDLPRGAKWMFRTLSRNFDQPDMRPVHELSSATIVLFELALDTLLIPALKEQIDDPLQAEVFRRIDIDESRHLAMDYWLLERKGVAYEGLSVDDLFERAHGRRRSLAERATGRYRMIRTLVAFIVGFGATELAMPTMRKATMKPEQLGKYLRRVEAVPKKAPHALDVPMYRAGLRGQGILLARAARRLQRPN